MEKVKETYNYCAKKPDSGLFDYEKAVGTTWSAFVTWDVFNPADMMEYLQENNQAFQGSLNRFRRSEWGGQTKAIAPTEPVLLRILQTSQAGDAPSLVPVFSSWSSEDQLLEPFQLAIYLREKMITSEFASLSSSLFFPLKLKNKEGNNTYCELKMWEFGPKFEH